MDRKSTLGKKLIGSGVPAFILLSQMAFGQEYIPDPSFEDYRTCPVRLGNFDADLLHWSAPTLGSTDYFHDCSTAMGTPENFNGSQRVNFGKGYAGMYLFAPDDYREYIQTQLSRQLEKGQRYRISFNISLAESSDYAIREFGICLSEKALMLPVKKELSKMQLHKVRDNAHRLIEIASPDFYKETRDWVSVQTSFIATGFENFLVVGNFRNNKQTQTYQTKKGAKKGAYYYVDMVSLTREQKAKEREPDENPPGEINADILPDVSNALTGILFEFDSDALPESAKAGLDSLMNSLRKDRTQYLWIRGHTDDLGSAAYNLRLSILRCETVVKYMVDRGWPKEQISWKGFGGSRPTSENTTEDGRSRNRRVELVLSHLANEAAKGN